MFVQRNPCTQVQGPRPLRPGLPAGEAGMEFGRLSIPPRREPRAKAWVGGSIFLETGFCLKAFNK